MAVWTAWVRVNVGSRVGRRWAGCFLLPVVAAGCGLQLETDYKYRPLNASATQRRAYYAPAFSPEKSAAEHEGGGSVGGNAGPGIGPSFGGAGGNGR